MYFTGHGIHKTLAEKGTPVTENTEEAQYNQEGEYGDCIVNTDGSLCSELVVSMVIASSLKKDAKICLFLDMCRTEGKVGS